MDQELIQCLDERFNRVDQRFDRVEQRLDSHDQRFDRIERRLDGHDQRFESIDRQFVQVNQRIDDRFEEVKRHTGILVEDLRKEVHLVAEGLLTHIEVRHGEDREYFDRKFEDMSVLFRSSYDHLQQQQNQLRQTQDQIHQRVENLERNQN
ncbi:MAG: hypothetical protein D4R81_03310 [Nitrospiraceae bacterium]|nr:MAG: hypothetical protein D4R81_03310 [Nitrospiraceae bacterium]